MRMVWVALWSAATCRTAAMRCPFRLTAICCQALHGAVASHLHRPPHTAMRHSPGCAVVGCDVLHELPAPPHCDALQGATWCCSRLRHMCQAVMTRCSPQASSSCSQAVNPRSCGRTAGGHNDLRYAAVEHCDGLLGPARYAAVHSLLVAVRAKSCCNAHHLRVLQGATVYAVPRHALAVPRCAAKRVAMCHVDSLPDAIMMGAACSAPRRQVLQSVLRCDRRRAAVCR